MFTYPKKNPPNSSSRPIVNNVYRKNIICKHSVSDILSTTILGFSYGLGFSTTRNIASSIINCNNQNIAKEISINNQPKDECYLKCKSFHEIYELCMNNKDISDCHNLLKEYQECLNKRK